MALSKFNKDDTITSDAAHSLWGKAAIVWVWGVQLVVLPANVMVLAILISVAASGGYSYQSLNALNVVINIVSIIFICVEITMYQFHDLKPRFYLISGIIKLLNGVASLGLLIFKLKKEWDTTDKYNHYYLFACLGISAIILITFLVALAYGIVISRQSAKRWKGLKTRFATN